MTKIITRACQSYDPREDDNLGTMVCFHRRYNLGDPPGTTKGRKHNITEPEELRKLVRSKDYISLPLYLYDHSGITMRTTDFRDPWDSGQVGYIIALKSDVREWFGVQRISYNVWLRAEKELISEVKAYDQWLTGETETVEVDDDYEEEEDDDQED